MVDDAPENITVLADLLQPFYRVLAANSGEKALAIAGRDPRPDLVLLDVMMPGLDGHQVFAKLRADPATTAVPVIFVTVMDSMEAELKGLAAGAVDYITKPILPPVVLARVGTHLELKRSRDLLADRNLWLDAEVDRRMRENDLIQLVSIRALAHLAETRDPETGNHILRTQAYVELLARCLQGHPHFAPLLTDHFIDLLPRSAPLHDVGKVGIPDIILLKPGKLTSEEWEIMMTHARIGSIAIERAEQDVKEQVEFLKLAKEITRWHHERWDGSGYPDGLVGDTIPVSARLMALADVFDALVTPRVYKSAMSFSEARVIIADGSGCHFDPDMARAFLDEFDGFSAIAERYRDED